MQNSERLSTVNYDMKTTAGSVYDKLAKTQSEKMFKNASQSGAKAKSIQDFSKMPGRDAIPCLRTGQHHNKALMSKELTQTTNSPVKQNRTFRAQDFTARFE